MQQRAFGRRPGVAPSPRGAENMQRRLEPVFAGPLPAAEATDAAEDASPSELSLEEELDAWKMERRHSLGLLLVPWRPLYLIASLSFGIASFALPDSINSWADWLLYALSAASLVVWFLGRREKAAT
ncbi:MAG TPA: hypothetical protein VGG10_01360 [Rhizomicrobium sp.]